MTGLVSCYKLDETSGLATDFWSINHGTVTGATPNQTGVKGKAYSFDGNDLIATATGITDFDITGNMAIFFRVKLLDNAAYYGVLGKFTGGSDYSCPFRFIGKEDTGMYLQMGGGGSSWTSFNFTGAIGNTNWHHYGIAITGTTIRGYIDNTHPISDATFTGTRQTNTQALTLGFYVGSYLKGTLDEVYVFNKAPSAAEVKSLFDLDDIFCESAPLIMQFTSVQGGTIAQNTITYKIDSGYPAYIDWGDTHTHALIADGTERTVTSLYTGINTTYTIKIYGAPDRFKTFKVTGGANYSLYFTLSEINKFTKLETLWIEFARCTGNTDTLVKSLKYLRFYHIDAPNDAVPIGTNIMTCSLGGLPSGLTFLMLEEFASTITGSILDIVSIPNLTLLSFDWKLLSPLHSEALNFETIPFSSDVATIFFAGTPGITYGGGAIPAWRNCNFSLETTTMSAATLDSLLIHYATTAVIADDGLAREWTFTGTTRTSASDAAVATLQANPPRKTIITA